MNATPSDWITLRSESLVAQVDPQGAQLSVLRDSLQNDLLWNGDPAVWKGRAPILFPIVGALSGGSTAGRVRAIRCHAMASRENGASR